MIDYRSRARLAEQRRSNSLVSAMKDSISSSLKGGGNEETLRLVVKREEDAQANEMLGKLGQAIAKIYGKIPQAVTLPRIFQVQGRVGADILSTPPLKVSNLSDLAPYFASLEKRLGQMATAISLIAVQEPQQMPDVKIPEFDTQSIVDAIDRIPGGGGNQDVIDKLVDIEQGIAELYNKPQMTPTPVTNVSLNALGGSILTTQIQLGSTVTPLPAVALANRRATQIFNNGSNTIYLGGLTVSSANGIPVTAGSYSDIFSISSTALVYGVSAAGQNNDLRVLEISDINTGR